MRAPSILTLLPSAVRTSITTADPTAAINPQLNLGAAVTPPPPVSCTTVIAYLNVTAVPGVDTILLKLQELEPVSQVWVDVAGAATLAQVATGLVRLSVGTNITNVAASASLVCLNASLPPNFRFQVVHSAASNFTYSLAIALETA